MNEEEQKIFDKKMKPRLEQFDFTVKILKYSIMNFLNQTEIPRRSRIIEQVLKELKEEGLIE